MAMGKIHIEGSADIGINEISCVCGRCNNRDIENASIEFNFKEQKVYYLCSKCKNMNEIAFGQSPIPPMPKTSMGR